MMKLLLVDDHALFRQGIQLLLDALPEQPTFLEAGNLADACQVLQKNTVDLVLLDLDLPDMKGLAGIKRLQDIPGSTPPRILLVTASEQQEQIAQAARLGVQGFLPKSFSPQVMLAVVQLVLAGGSYFPELGSLPGKGSLPQDQPHLTRRQLDILQLLAERHSNKEIADSLGLRVNTVRSHMAAILQILQADNRHEAARKAVQLGLVK